MKIFFYITGEPVSEGDIVSAGLKRAVVEQIFSSQSAESKDYNCFKTGGMLLRFDDGDLQLWRWTDEDLVLLEKNPG